MTALPEAMFIPESPCQHQIHYRVPQKLNLSHFDPGHQLFYMKRLYQKGIFFSHR